MGFPEVEIGNYCHVFDRHPRCTFKLSYDNLLLLT